MNYLVTGGAGFIGSHLANRLFDDGHKVRVLDNLSFGDRDKLNPGIELIEGDILDSVACDRACKNMHGIFHLAAFSRSGPSFDKSDQCNASNVTGTLNILNAAIGEKVEKIVYSGSSTFYGDQAGLQHEEMDGDFLNFYGLTKYVGELYTLQYSRNFGLKSNILRYFNVYGPGQPGEGAYALVLGIFLKRFKAGLNLEIHGSGEQRRDFIHVNDVVEANIKAMESDVSGEIFNIGSGENYSINDLADHFPIDRYHTERREGDAEETLADIKKAKSLLGWKPKISLRDGINQLMKQS
tara:strand:+ start:3065 stop:3952 length:888 start_codon:yes stop_codon:yes gene_type:complete